MHKLESLVREYIIENPSKTIDEVLVSFRSHAQAVEVFAIINLLMVEEESCPFAKELKNSRDREKIKYLIEQYSDYPNLRELLDF